MLKCPVFGFRVQTVHMQWDEVDKKFVMINDYNLLGWKCPLLQTFKTTMLALAPVSYNRFPHLLVEEVFTQGQYIYWWTFPFGLAFHLVFYTCTVS